MKRIIMIANSFFKSNPDYTQTNLKTDTSWGGSPSVSGSLVITGQDNTTPPLGQLYLVTIEPVILNPGEHPQEGYARILKEREAGDAQEFGKLKRVFR